MMDAEATSVKEMESMPGLALTSLWETTGTPADNAGSVDAAAGNVDLPLKIAADAAIGRHRRQYFKVYVKTAGGEVLHHVGGGEIRVDKPLPPELRGDEGASGGQR